MDMFATGVDAVMAWIPEASLTAMDGVKVEPAVPSVSSPGVHFGDAAQARDVARECNDYAMRLGRTHPGRFGLFAALPMPDVEGTILEAERALSLDRGARRRAAERLRRPLPWRCRVPAAVRVAGPARHHHLRLSHRCTVLRGPGPRSGDPAD